MKTTIIAGQCMGQLWCTEHLEYDQTDLDDGFVLLITDFAVLCGDYDLTDECCHGCGESF